MRSHTKNVLRSAVIMLILAGCGSTTTTTATGVSSPTAASTPTPGVTVAGLQSLGDRLYPSGSSGRQTCFNGDTTVAQCPVTGRLRAAIEAQFAQATGGGADPVCGCQNIDSSMSFTSTADPAGSGGTIHMSSFGGSDHVDIIVINQGGQLVADDIRYCSNTPPSSVYPGETVSC